MQISRFSRYESLGPANQPEIVQRVLEVIEVIHVFDDFERSDILTMLDHMTCYRALPGSQIIVEGETGDFMILLLQGNMEIVKKDADGIMHHLRVVGVGKTLGEMSLIDGEPRSAGCVARSEVTFAVLDRDSLWRIMAQTPDVGCKILMYLLLISNSRLRETSAQVTRLLRHSDDWI